MTIDMATTKKLVRSTTSRPGPAGPEADKTHDYHLKVIVIGSYGVGKTSLLRRYTEGIFSPAYKATIGVEFFVKFLEVKGYDLRLHLWDTAGMEKYRSITAAYYKGAHGVIVMYDCTHAGSFDNLSKWLEEVQQYADPSVPVLLVGNKSDLQTERQVTTEEAQAFAQQRGLPVLETSAKDDTNVEQAFMNLAETIVKSPPKKREEAMSLPVGESVKAEEKAVKKKGCCG